MVEDDDDYDGGDDPYGMGKQRRNTGQSTRSVASTQAAAVAHEADRRMIADYQSKVEILQDKVAGLEASLGESEARRQATGEDEVGSRGRRGGGGGADGAQDRKNQWDDVRIDLEGKLADAESLNNNLRSEIDRVKEDAGASDSQLRAQLQQYQDELRDQKQELDDLRRRVQQTQNGGGGGGEQYQLLHKEHEELKQDLKEQEEVSLRRGCSGGAQSC